MKNFGFGLGLSGSLEKTTTTKNHRSPLSAKLFAYKFAFSMLARSIGRVGVRVIAPRVVPQPKFVAGPFRNQPFTTPISRFFSDNSTNAYGNGKNGEEPPGSAQEGSPTDGSTSNDETKKLQEEVKQLKDQVLRSYAEGENIRRIAKRDVDNARDYANSKFAKSLLSIADDLERAMATVPPERRNSGDAVFDNLVVGIEMTEKNLQKVFSEFNVTKYGKAGEKFDPNFHEALFQVPDASKEADIIASVVKSGYKLKDRVLRPAQVGATVKPDT